MNKQELIEMLRSKIEYANDIQNTILDIFVSEATDLLRELEDEWISVDERLLECQKSSAAQTSERVNVFKEKDVNPIRPHGKGCNSIDTACEECYAKFREWQTKEANDIDDRKYSIKEIKEALLKQMFLMSHNNGYPSMAVPKATILSLGQLMRGAPDLPQPPKTEK